MMQGPFFRSGLCVLAAIGCTRAAPASDGADNDPAPGDREVRAVVSYNGDRAIEVAGMIAMVEGSQVDDLVSGLTYELSLTPTLSMQDGRALYELVSYRQQVLLIGTASHVNGDIVVDTVNGHTWRLTGSMAETLFDTLRSEPPALETAAMTVGINAFAAQDDERARVVSWGLAPVYRCLVAPLPVQRLQLANITADHALDLEEWTTYRGEFLTGSGTCVETAGTYACTLLSWGSVRETWTFPAPTGDQSTFDFTTVATGAGVSERAFGCQVVQIAELRGQSDG